MHKGTYVAPAINSSDVLRVTKVDSMTRNTMSETVMMLIRAAGLVTRKQMMIGRTSKITLRVTTMVRASVRTNGVEDTSTSGSLERFGYLSRWVIMISSIGRYKFSRESDRTHSSKIFQYAYQGIFHQGFGSGYCTILRVGQALQVIAVR